MQIVVQKYGYFLATPELRKRVGDPGSCINDSYQVVVVVSAMEDK